LWRHRAFLGFVLVCSATLIVGGCKNAAGVFQDQNEGGLFKSADIFAKPDWARPSTARVSLGPQGPVGAEDLVGADGQCASPPAATAQAAESPPAQSAAAADGDREVGSVAGDPAASTRASASADPNLQKTEPSMPQVAGGIALGMTECQAVRRAGVPTNVAISAGDKGERTVVLTFLSGPWPGIYTFADGRLKVIDRAPAQPKPAGAPAKKTPKKKTGVPKTASQNFKRSYVQ
jgi:hypothetical protein